MQSSFFSVDALKKSARPTALKLEGGQPSSQFLTAKTAEMPRVLHVVENLDRGAIENWLVRMLRYANSRGIRLNWTFYCTLGFEGRIEHVARELGARVVHSPVVLHQQIAFARALRDEVRSGHYDVLHCHHDLVSGLYLVAAFGLPIKTRVVHVHNAGEDLLTPNPIKKILYKEPLRRTCLALADRIVGISHHTLDTFLNGRARRIGRDAIHYSGVDSTAFLTVDVKRTTFRQQLSLPDNALILLFAGRMVPEKNPLFVVEVLSELRQRVPQAVAVFVGTGSQEAPVLDLAGELGIHNAVRLLGWRGDLPEIMANCDLFVLPSVERPMEGFGLAVVEAQLAGLRLLISQGVPDDPLLESAVFRRLSLSSGASAWAHAASELFENSSARSFACFRRTRAIPDGYGLLAT